MQRTYEVMFIVRPDVVEEDLDKLIAGLEGGVKQQGGNVKSVEKLGVRRLAYQVKKFNDGQYVLFHVEADGAVVAELERRLRVSEPVIKFLSVRMDEEEKRLAKVKALRDSRKKQSAQAPAPVAAAEPITPAASAEEAASA
jgi:small subunit ribosomal protein S6